MKKGSDNRYLLMEWVHHDLLRYVIRSLRGKRGRGDVKGKETLLVYVLLPEFLFYFSRMYLYIAFWLSRAGVWQTSAVW